MSVVSVDLPYKILGCAFAVYNELGPFFRESIYQRALEVALSQAGLKWEQQRNVPVKFRGLEVGKGILDLVVENQIILELKAVESIHQVLFPSWFSIWLPQDYNWVSY